MPFCTSCGRQNPDDARFCSQCGTRLVTPEPAEPSGAGETPGAGDGESTATISIGTGADKVETSDRQLNAVDAAAVDALPSGHALLVVQRGPGSGSRFLLDADVVNAGRHPDSEIFLDDVTVSRRHAEFHRSGDTFTVSDVGSLNGTYVNRDRIDRVQLTDGDEVQIGKYRLVFFAGHETA
ncbi:MULTISPECIES: FHA domain-containing protein [unclassified Nocardioides]|uniref:FHA domain-containing protein n=1 Tax=unclassified Nocardioides TaxID=2615069 RepID=UPI0009EF9C86|nr:MULTISPECIES: FHA domain-containing protein [unclassified Nocardioides]GAW48449.1 forkhead-associated protein [Nocardioides sp. PD653-B2]GAW53374.1 forkhead-associated protein [Nocardioides sp. PD653]